MKRKNLLICAFISAMSFTVCSGYFLSVGKFAHVFGAVHTAECTWNHYDRVEPTEDSHGSKEFWACCTHPGEFVLEEPTSENITDMGAFSGAYFDELTNEDLRYIDPLPKTRTINFYCDDRLCETQYVKDGNKVSEISLEDFEISGWYTDKELTNGWNFLTDTVDGNLNLYASYVAKEKTFSVDLDNAPIPDEYGFGETSTLEKEVCVSKGVEPDGFFATLEERGILFNKSEIGLIKFLSVVIDTNNFSSAKLYYGNTPLSFDNSLDLSAGNNLINLSNVEYFTIQNTGGNNINITSLSLTYITKTIYSDTSIPTVVINTKNSQAVTSRIDYVDCDVSTIGADKDVNQLKAKIKIRGNSTANCPKKPYRIKLDKKNSLFGYAKAKNWVLLADYMDGSNMHNYTALKFAKMVRGDSTFGVDPLHVNVILNGENIGLYEFGEHIEAKEGRLNIEQDNIWEKSFDEINFYIERDLSTAQDSTEVEGETYFRVNMENYSPSQYVFALKYPEKADFEEELESGEVDTHEEEFQTFFNSLKDYMTDICNKFVAYSSDKNEFDNVASSVDMESLALYAVTDQAFNESDHNQKSFKMYRENGGLLKFGPNWDYDSCAYGLPYKGTYVLNPYEVGTKTFNSKWFGEKWGYMLYNDTTNGRQLFKDVWDNISSDTLDSFINSQLNEMKSISYSSVQDCERWMNNQFYCLFDNQTYYYTYISNQLPYLYSSYLG